MNRPNLPAAAPASLAAALLALGLSAPAPLAAQQTFDLPPASPTPTPAPAGPADERAGVAIPPRAVPIATPTPTQAPVIQPLPSPSAARPPLTLPAPRRTPGAVASPPASPVPAPSAAPDAAQPAPPASPGFSFDPLAPATPAPQAAPQSDTTPDASEPPVNTFGPVEDSPGQIVVPEGWLYAAGGLSLAALLGAGAWPWRRRKPRPLHLAAPVAGAAAGTGPAMSEPPRLDITLEITGATRSLMMFTVDYRLTIANRSDRAVNDCNAAVRIACARASAAEPAPGAAQSLGTFERIGPHQARSITGTARLPLSAIQPLRQGQTPLFIPLAHVTLESEALRAFTKTFVIGTPSPSGRVHPISLDQPPGSIAGLVAQAVALPAASAAA